MMRWRASLGVCLLVFAIGLEAEPSQDVNTVATPAATAAPLELTLEIQSWAHRVAPPMAPPELRLRLLLRALADEEDGALQEIEGYTGTAIEAFESRRADCVAFAMLFVALSREVGVPTYFVMTRSAERFDDRGDLQVAVRHLAVGYGPVDRLRVIDFGGKSRPKRGLVEIVDDATASAIYHSNQGTQRLLRGQALAALLWLERAVELAPDLQAAQDNLAVAKRRLGRILPGQALVEMTPQSLVLP